MVNTHHVIMSTFDQFCDDNDNEDDDAEIRNRKMI